MIRSDRRWRRRSITLAILWLAIGAIVSTGIAWWQAILYQRDIDAEGTRHMGDEIGNSGSRGPPIDPSLLKWPIGVPSGWPLAPDEVHTGRSWTHTTTMAIAGAHDRPLEGHLATLTGYGWPLRSVGEWWCHAPPSTSWTSQGGYISLPPLRRWPYLWMVPIYPLWPGFALNTLLYAALAFALYQLPLALRRHRRRARNQCPRCAYALKGLPPNSPCPECGQSIPTR